MLGFSGVRISESLSFNKESYSEHKFADIIVPTLTGTISKTQEGGIPKRETWVTHPIAKKALELVYDLSEFARRHYKALYVDNEPILNSLDSAFLALAINYQKGNPILRNTQRKLSDFFKRNNIISNQTDVDEFNLLNPERVGKLILGGYLPKQSSHDFRRTFAVFLVRNKLGNVMTLKHQYKHLNIVMTQWYMNNYELTKALDLIMDSELQELIKEANISVTTDSLFNIYNSETLSGKEGERIIEERDKSDYAGTLYQSRSEIERQVRSGSVSVVEHPIGYCFNPACTRICSSDRSSLVCQHAVITPEKAKGRLPFRERLIKRFNALNDGRFYMASIQTDMALKIEAIETTLSLHNIKFTPFKVDIKANSIAVKEI